MSNSFEEPLEQQIARWRAYLSRRRPPADPQLEPLERDLREQLEALTAAGLAADEAFLVALKRAGSQDPSSREFLAEHVSRLWRHGAGAEAADEWSKAARSEFVLVLVLAVAAAVAIKIPALFGFRFGVHDGFYARNASLFVFPLLALYFIWKRAWGGLRRLWLALPFLAGAVFANVYPFGKGSDTEVLTALHLPVAFWLVVGFAYVRGRWFADGGRAEFVRFSGELIIYYALIALGGGVFIALTVMLFQSIGIKAERLVTEWLIPCGATGAVLIGSWLVEARRAVMQSLAPMLTRLFTPLFTALLIAFLGVMAWTGSPIKVEREVLIGFDLLLVLVVGLVLYAATARDPLAPPNFFESLQVVLLVSALVVDAAALAAMTGRISEYGFTANRAAALGLNLILLANLARSAWLYAGFLRRRRPFAALLEWQIAYLPVYALWAALVVVLFPPLFGYR